MKYTTLLFDADGTLFDFEATERVALKQTFQLFAYPFDEDIKKRYLDINHKLWCAYEEGRKTREEVIYSRFGLLFKEMGIPDDGIAFENAYQMALSKGHDLIDNAMEVVARLSADFDLYIASNGVVATQYQRLNDSHLRPYFKDVFISEEIGFQKPRKEYFTCCFEKIQEKDHERILMIGDSLSSDMQGGIHAGIDTCWFNPNGIENINQLPITYEIQDLRELYYIVGKDEKQ